MSLEINGYTATAIIVSFIMIGFTISHYINQKVKIEEIKADYYISATFENTKIENSQVIYSPKNRQITIFLPEWIDIEFNDANQDIIEMDKNKDNARIKGEG